LDSRSLLLREGGEEGRERMARKEEKGGEGTYF